MSNNQHTDTFDPTSEHIRAQVKKQLDELTGSPGRPGVVPQETLAQALGVSIPTIARWARGHTTPSDEETIKTLHLIYNQRRVWYLRALPFLLSVFTLSRGDADDARHHSTYFSQAILKPVSDNVVMCELTLDMSFDSLSLVVFSAHKDKVGLSLTADGVGERSVIFRGYNGELKRNKVIHIFLIYSV